MTFKPAIWYPIAVVLSAINLVGVGFAVGPGEPWHAATHAALALGFGLWAQRLRQGLSTRAVSAMTCRKSVICSSTSQQYPMSKLSSPKGSASPIAHWYPIASP
jgi:hypothetical protein